MTRKLCSLLLAGMLSAGPAVAQTSSSTFDHELYDELLSEHVTARGMVDYDAFARSDDFQTYLDALADVDMARLSTPERLALWINAYNAYTIELINRHEEDESIRNINTTFGLGSGPWKERFADVGGETYTLDEIEHEIIRPRFQEPRIHFALVCAAMGCPPLRQEAYTGPRIDEQLEEQARVFLRRHTDKNRVDVEEGKIYLSSIFDWYREDFPKGRDGLGEYLADFFPPGPERELLKSGDFEIEHTDYDWSLNAQR
ncbi:MAG: DUF547 domain-containing protein [Gemmatimonadota bacterium]|nr:DUF547 domain-containing protein [Gemmatimonadota bacterium]